MESLSLLERKALEKYCELENLNPSLINDLTVVDRSKNEVGNFVFFNEKPNGTVYQDIPSAFVGESKTLIGFLLYIDGEKELGALECFIADAHETWPVDDNIIEFEPNS